MTDVRGRTAFITGGGNGIGLGIARALARAGARLVLADIDAPALAAAKAELAATTAVVTCRLDVRDRDAYAAAVDAAESELGPVSVLVNNAGVCAAVTVDALSHALWDWAIGVNLGGVINGVRTLLPRMVARGAGGHIVNTASTAGLAGHADGVVCCTAKFGVVGLSESMAPELAPAGIGVTLLCAGPVATGLGRHSLAAAAAAGVSLPSAPVREWQRPAVLGADAVGDMVRAAIEANQFYLHTDRSMAAIIAARSQALLDAAPPEEAAA